MLMRTRSGPRSSGTTFRLMGGFISRPAAITALAFFHLPTVMSKRRDGLTHAPESPWRESVFTALIHRATATFSGSAKNVLASLRNLSLFEILLSAVRTAASPLPACRQAADCRVLNPIPPSVVGAHCPRCAKFQLRTEPLMILDEYRMVTECIDRVPSGR